MKVVGLTYQEFLGAMALADSNLKFTVQGSAITPGAINHTEKVVEGFPSYASSVAPTWKCKHQGQTYHKPCAHMAYRVVKACFNAGASKVWFEKIQFTHPSLLKKSALVKKFAGKGLTCSCPEVTGLTPVAVIEPSAVVKLAPKDKIPTGWVDALASAASKAPVVAPEAPKKALKTFAPIEGAPITGESLSVPKGTRPTLAVVTGFYVLAELDRVVQSWRRVHYQSAPGASSCTHRVDTWCEAKECPDSYDPLDGLPTRTIRHRHPGKPCDPCTMKDRATRERASAEKSSNAIERVLVEGGLASYREEWQGEDSENINVGRRILFQEYVAFSHAYKAQLARNLFDYLTLASVEEAKYNHVGYSVVNKLGAIPYDPRTTLPVIEYVFNHGKFSGGYGGPKWANIAKSAGLYFKFADYPVVFADHVVDITHNGGLAFNKGYIMDYPALDTYMAMLDHKRAKSLLDGSINLTLTAEVYVMATRVLSHAPNAGTLRKVVGVVKDTPMPLVKWGSEVYTLNAPMLPESTPVPMAPKVEVSFPEPKRQSLAS